MVSCAAVTSGAHSRRGSALAWRETAELIHHFARNLRGQTRFAALQRSDGFEEFVLLRIFQQIGMGSGAHRFKHGFIVIERRQYKYLGVRKRACDLASGGDAAL